MSAFRHRRNKDGSWDSICEKCFLTVALSAKAWDLKALEEAEAEHICNMPKMGDIEETGER